MEKTTFEEVNCDNMTYSLVEIEDSFSNVWSDLTLPQKRALLEIATRIRDVSDKEFLDEYNREIDEALQEIAKGNFYTHEEVVRMMEDDEG